MYCFLNHLIKVYFFGIVMVWYLSKSPLTDSCLHDERIAHALATQPPSLIL